MLLRKNSDDKRSERRIASGVGKNKFRNCKNRNPSNRSKRKIYKIVTGAMPLIAWILPLMVLSLAIAFNYQFWSDVYYTKHGMEAPIYNLDSRWFEMGNTFIQYLFYGKIAGKLSPFHDSDGTTGSKFLDKLYK